MIKKKKVRYSEKDKDIFDSVSIAVASGLCALGLAEMIRNKSVAVGLLYIAASFLIILFNSTFIRKKSDKIRAK